MAYNVIESPFPQLVIGWERAKKGKIYPAGSICLQVSATRGQLVYLDSAQEVDSRYAVIAPERNRVRPYYLYCIMELQLPEFLASHQTGLNIRPEILEEFKIRWHPDPADQQEAEAEQRAMDEAVRKEAEALDQIKKLKEYFLDRCFPETGKNEPRIRWIGGDLEQ